MAKYEKSLRGSFDELLGRLEKGILRGSISASFEDGSDWSDGEARVSVRVYERYSMTGSNRVSLNITLIGRGEELYVSAITSGGSQALFFKINTLGEGSFLQCAVDIIEECAHI